MDVIFNKSKISNTPKLTIDKDSFRVAPAAPETVPEVLETFDTVDFSYFKTRKLKPHEQKLMDTYNSLWKELKLPENLKPELDFVDYKITNWAGFNKEIYTIEINTKTAPVLSSLGIDKSILRHEIKHVEQFIDIVHLLGVKNTLRFYMKNLHSRIPPEALGIEEEMRNKPKPDAKRVREYLEAERNYNYDFTANKYSFFKNPIKYLKNYRQYKKNLLEIEAEEAAKAYKPSKLKLLKNIWKTIF